MMTAIEFMSGPAWQRVGWTLLHFVWQGAAVAALASLAVGLLRLRHGPGRYAAYLAALVGMAVCPALTFFALPAPAVSAKAVIVRQPSRPVVYVAAISASEVAPGHSSGAVTAASAPVADQSPTRPDWRELIVGRLDMALPWIVAGWLMGVLVLSARLALGIAGSWRWRRDLVPLPESLGECVAALASRLGLGRGAWVFVSNRAVQAIAVGWLRPMVLVPASFLSQMPPEVLEGVIAHELAHIVRRDLWVNLFQRVVEALLFYHPAVWWVSGRLRYERELCCDELAVRATGRQAVYAQALEWAGRAVVSAREARLAVGFARGHKALLVRVRHVLGLAPVGEYAHGGLAGLAGVAAVVLALVAFGGSQVRAGGARNPSLAELPPKWPEFKAKKVSFAEAGLKPLSAPELIKRLTEAQGIMKRSIVKTRTHTTWWNDYRNSKRRSTSRLAPGPWRDYSGRMDEDEEGEVRFDGQRCAVHERRWTNAAVRIQEREPWKPGLAHDSYRSWLWEGTRQYSYSFDESNPPGEVIISEGVTFSEKDMSILGAEAQLRGYYGYEAGSLDSVLLAARSIRPRPELEEIGASPCYVLDANTVNGKYVLWIDPAHGYNVARAEVSRRKGDLAGTEDTPPSGDATRHFVLDNARFAEVDGTWAPMECEIRIESQSSDGLSKCLVRHARTQLTLKPDFEALRSFLPDDIKEGATAFVVAANAPRGTPLVEYVWHNGRPVPVDSGGPRKGKGNHTK